MTLTHADKNAEVSGSPQNHEASQPWYKNLSLGFAVFLGFPGMVCALVVAWIMNRFGHKPKWTHVLGARYWLISIASSVIAIVLSVVATIGFALITLQPLHPASPLAPAINQGPLAPSTASAPVKVGDPAVTVISPLTDRLKLSDGLPGSAPVSAAASDTVGTIITSLNLAWHNACVNHDPRYLWGAFDTGSASYQRWSKGDVAVCGIITLSGTPTTADDPQAAASITSRWYALDIKLFGDSPNITEQPYLMRLVDAHWLVVAQAPPVGLGFDAMEQVVSGQTKADDHAAVTIAMLALRQQAFVQHSAQLLAMAFNNATVDPAYQADLKRITGPAPSFTTVKDAAFPDSPARIAVILTEKFADGTTTSSPTQFTWWGLVWTIG